MQISSNLYSNKLNAQFAQVCMFDQIQYSWKVTFGYYGYDITIGIALCDRKVGYIIMMKRWMDKFIHSVIIFGILIKVTHPFVICNIWRNPESTAAIKRKFNERKCWRSLSRTDRKKPLVGSRCTISIIDNPSKVQNRNQFPNVSNRCSRSHCVVISDLLMNRIE